MVAGGVKEMREIKFRGKVSNYERNAAERIGKWVYGGYVVDEFVEPSRHIIISQGDPCICHLDNNAVDPDTIGQYTGLKDKHGEEIYEHDIGKFYGKHIGKIVYRIGGFFFEEPSGRHTPLQLFNPLDFEIIGNIHDNPELVQK
jgi:uncharacterized phage protein (TIGR01671 family)